MPPPPKPNKISRSRAAEERAAFRARKAEQVRERYGYSNLRLRSLPLETNVEVSPEDEPKAGRLSINDWLKQRRSIRRGGAPYIPTRDKWMRSETPRKCRVKRQNNEIKKAAAKSAQQENQCSTILRESKRTANAFNTRWQSLDLPPVTVQTNEKLAHEIGTAIVEKLMPKSAVKISKYVTSKLNLKAVVKLVRIKNVVTNQPSTSQSAILSKPSIPVAAGPTPQYPNTAIQDVNRTAAPDGNEAPLELPELDSTFLKQKLFLEHLDKPGFAFRTSERDEFLNWFNSDDGPSLEVLDTVAVQLGMNQSINNNEESENRCDIIPNQAMLAGRDSSDPRNPVAQHPVANEASTLEDCLVQMVLDMEEFYENQ